MNDLINETEVEERPKQSEKNEKLARQVQSLFRNAYEAKQQLSLNRKWATFDDYKHGRQNPKQSEDHPGSTTNIIHPIIESNIADLVDRPLDVEADGEEPSDDLYSDQVRHQMEYILYRNDFKTKLNVSEHDRLELGTAVIKTHFDEEALNGRGLPTFDVISPANFFPDPKWNATHRLQECEFVIHAVSRPLSWIKRKFPKMGQHVHRETSVPYDPDIWEKDNSDEVSPETSQKALLLECYLKDENNELYCVHVANHIVLEDSREVLKDQKDDKGEPKKLQRRDQFPFVAIPCYVQRGIGWGQGDVELLIPTQDLINDLDDQIRMNARLMGNPQITVGQGAGRAFDIRKWTNKAGLRVPMRDHNAYSVVQAHEVSRDVPLRREKAFEEADRISGRADVTRGEQPGGVTAASAIIALQQAGQKGVIHKMEMFKQGWKLVLELLYDEMMDNWEEEMWVRLQGDKPDYEFINPQALRNVPVMIPNAAAGPNEDSIVPLTETEEIMDDDGNPMMMDDFDMDEEGNEFPIQRPMTRQIEVTREAQFDFRMGMGNGLPSDKAFIYQTLIELSNMQIEGKPLITWNEMREYLREQVGIPLDDDQAIEQQMQMMQQQMGGGMGPQGLPPGAPQGGPPPGPPQTAQPPPMMGVR